MFRNLDNNSFEELIEAAGPRVAAAHSARGCAFGEFDNDGDIDSLIINMNEPPSLLRNDIRGKLNWIGERIHLRRSWILPPQSIETMQSALAFK